MACLASSLAAPAPSQGPQLYLDIIDMAAISRMSPQQLEALAEGLAAEEIMRYYNIYIILYKSMFNSIFFNIYGITRFFNGSITTLYTNLLVIYSST